MTDIELIKIISKKIGREYGETYEIISQKIGFVVDENNSIIQLCMNDCNLMNETIPKELWELQHLERLYLSSNMIAYFPKGLLRLHNLVHLELNANQLRVITGEISQLTHLESINLAGNQLETLPLDIGKMPSLKKIRLNSNRLIVLPTLNPDLEWLKLESIDLDGADLKELPSWLFSLKSLKYLSLSKLHLNHFPELIYNLSKLEGVYLDSTQFPVWPNKILLPEKMRYIVLDGAYLPLISQFGILQIPDAIIELKPKYVSNQESIELEKNYMTLQVSLGGDISNGYDESQLFHDNPEVSYNYLKNLYNNIGKIKNDNSKYVRLKDIKIALLGAGAAGKTSLVQRLCLSNPDDDNIALETVQTTHGVNIDYCMSLHNVWDKTNKQYEDFTAHFWDFGGQDKYRGINRLLLTDKAIYIIVIDSRAQSIPDVWLEMVKIYAPNSKIILVANKIDENPRLNINFKYYCDKYPQLYNCLFKISCKYPNSGINCITDIYYAIKKIIEEQMNQIAPIGRVEWINIQLEINKQYHLKQKVLLSSTEFVDICEYFGVIDEKEQSELLSNLNTCGSCIAIDDEDVSILSPNWLANYLYIFYNSSNQNKAIMDYKKEYIPMLKNLKEYSEYRELITDYLEARELCAVFRDDKNIKKIFIPMFLSENQPDIVGFSQEKPLLKYKWSSKIIPEYEFHKFLVREFLQISKEHLYVWQYGLYFEYLDTQIYLQLMNDGIFVEIWSYDIVKCGKCFQWLRKSILEIVPENFFNEYILVEYENKTTLFPYNTLEVLNSWNIESYCLPEQDDFGILIPIDVKIISQKCGLRGRGLEDESIDVNMLIKNMLKKGDVIMKLTKCMEM